MAKRRPGTFHDLVRDLDERHAKAYEAPPPRFEQGKNPRRLVVLWDAIDKASMRELQTRGAQ